MNPISLLVLFTILGAPLFIIFGAVGLYNFHQAGLDISNMITPIQRIAELPMLVTIPLFTFAGYMMAESGTPKRLVNLAQAFVGWLPGGLAIVTLLTCAFFTAFTGASGVTIIALGGLLYPVLMQERYGDGFSMGLVTSCGSLGMLFPPSLPLILYGVVAQVDINKLFIAGVVPGLLLIGIFSIYSIFFGIRKKVHRVPFNWRNIWKALKGAGWEVPLPIMILVGIYGGWITATEAAAVTAFYVLVVEVFIYRDLKLFTDIPRVIRESMLLVGGILIIFGMVLGLTDYLILAQIPQKLFELTSTTIEAIGQWLSQFPSLAAIITDRVVFLIFLNIFLLIAGSLMDMFSAIVVIPLVLPVAIKYGINPVHLGIIFLTNLEIGYLTPPAGLNLFMSAFRFGRSIIELYRVSLPFLVLFFIGLAIITYWPALSLFLVN